MERLLKLAVAVSKILLHAAAECDHGADDGDGHERDDERIFDKGLPDLPLPGAGFHRHGSIARSFDARFALDRASVEFRWPFPRATCLAAYSNNS